MSVIIRIILLISLCDYAYGIVGTPVSLTSYQFFAIGMVKVWGEELDPNGIKVDDYYNQCNGTIVNSNGGWANKPYVLFPFSCIAPYEYQRNREMFTLPAFKLIRVQFIVTNPNNYGITSNIGWNDTMYLTNYWYGEQDFNNFILPIQNRNVVTAFDLTNIYTIMPQTYHIQGVPNFVLGETANNGLYSNFNIQLPAPGSEIKEVVPGTALSYGSSLSNKPFAGILKYISNEFMTIYDTDEANQLLIYYNIDSRSHMPSMGTLPITLLQGDDGTIFVNNENNSNVILGLGSRGLINIFPNGSFENLTTFSQWFSALYGDYANNGVTITPFCSASWGATHTNIKNNNENICNYIPKPSGTYTYTCHDIAYDGWGGELQADCLNKEDNKIIHSYLHYKLDCVTDPNFAPWPEFQLPQQTNSNFNLKHDLNFSNNLNNFRSTVRNENGHLKCDEERLSLDNINGPFIYQGCYIYRANSGISYLQAYCKDFTGSYHFTEILPSFCTANNGGKYIGKDINGNLECTQSQW